MQVLQISTTSLKTIIPASFAAIIFTLVVSTVSYEYFEMRFLRMKPGYAEKTN
jgi:hypothetical protein